MPELNLKEWFRERSNWMQEVAKKILEGQGFTIDELAGICILEVLGKFNNPGLKIHGGLFGTSTSNTIRLNSIQDIQGINTLSPKKPLSFGNNNLAVIYGLNGSGKSGYVRILKHACGARHPGELHQSVFSDSHVERKCKIVYEKDGTAIPLEWLASSGIVEDLCGVDIFDTMCGWVLVTEENEVTYEPPVLSFLSELIETSEKVSGRLDEMTEKLVSAKPQIPVEYSGAELGKWYNDLSSNTTSEQIALNCSWSEKNEEVLQGLEARLSEKSPTEKANHLRKQKEHLDALIRELEIASDVLTDETCQKIFDLKQDVAKKKEAAKTAAEQIFQGAPLDGIGTEVWKQLWEKARQYSEQEAYREVAFPYTEKTARCVLCQQKLSEDAKGRLQSFEGYVKGTLETEAAAAVDALQNAVEAFPDYPTDDGLRVKLDACGWSDEGKANSLIAIFSGLRKRHEELLQAEKIDELSASPESNEWLEHARTWSATYEETAQKFDQVTTVDKRAELQERSLELQTKKWLSQQHESIKKEVERLQKIDLLHEAKRLTSTTGLSKKKGELAELLITEAFIQGFKDELKRLGAGKIRVELAKTKVSKGRVLHKLRLCGTRGCGLEDVLSEGEYRIIALAAFLADVAGKDDSTPFVFDDPISSLDQDFEEAVVQRLIELAKDRQLIIFTHRLSLLGLVQDYGKRAGIKPHVICVRQEAWGTGEPGGTPFFAKKPEKALNALIDERLVGAKKIIEEHGQEIYEPYAKALCSDFRILLERMIESELLADVIQRYRRAVNTLGKIDKLARITAPDCKLFDDMMTKYSRYEHSQPGEAPVQPPLPDELRLDFETLREWRKEFLNRGAQ
jgi:hypothetical protein